MSSMLAAVRGALAAAQDDELFDNDSTGAQAPQQKEDAMSASQSAAGIPQADHDAAVNSARQEGEAAGRQAESDRLAGALGADGVRGDGVRMAAALDLARKSPGMSGADVAGFVVANVAQGGKPNAGSYEEQRAAAAGLAQPGARSGGASKPRINTGDIYAARRKAVKEG